MMTMPWWLGFSVLIAYAVGVAVYLRVQQRVYAGDDKVCGLCGYPAVGLPGLTCPECGWAGPRRRPTWWNRQPPIVRKRALCLAWGFGTVALAVCCWPAYVSFLAPSTYTYRDMLVLVEVGRTDAAWVSCVRTGHGFGNRPRYAQPADPITDLRLEFTARGDLRDPLTRLASSNGATMRAIQQGAPQANAVLTVDFAAKRFAWYVPAASSPSGAAPVSAVGATDDWKMELKKFLTVYATPADAWRIDRLVTMTDDVYLTGVAKGDSRQSSYDRAYKPPWVSGFEVLLGYGLPRPAGVPDAPSYFMFAAVAIGIWILGAVAIQRRRTTKVPCQAGDREVPAVT